MQKKSQRKEWNENFNSNREQERVERPESVSDDEDTKKFKEEFRQKMQKKQDYYRKKYSKAEREKHASPTKKQDNNIKYFQPSETELKKGTAINPNQLFGIATTYGTGGGNKTCFRIDNQGDKFEVLPDMSHKQLIDLLGLNINDVRRKHVNKCLKYLNLEGREVKNNFELQEILLQTINGPPGWKRIRFENTGKVIYWDLKKHKQDMIPNQIDVNEELQQLKQKYKLLKQQKTSKPEPIRVIPRPKDNKPKRKIEMEVQDPKPRQESPKKEPKKEEKFEIDGPVKLGKEDDGSIVISTDSKKVYTRFNFATVDLLHNLDQECHFDILNMNQDASVAIGILDSSEIKDSGYSVKFKKLPSKSIFITSTGFLVTDGSKTEQISNFKISKGDKIVIKCNLNKKTVKFINATTKQEKSSQIPIPGESQKPLQFCAVYGNPNDNIEIDYVPGQEEAWEPHKPQKPRFATKRTQVAKKQDPSAVTIGIYGEQKAKDIEIKNYVNTKQCDDETELDEHFNYKRVKLGKDKAFEDFKILAGVFHHGTNFPEEFQKNMAQIESFGFKVEMCKEEDDYSEKLISGNYDISILIATQKFTGNQDKFLEALDKFLNKDKKSLYIGADNDPYFTHANIVLEKFFDGMTLTGDYIGTQMIYAGDRADMSHFDRHHTISYGINNFYEGNTICHPVNVHKDFSIFAYNSEDEPLILYSEQNKSHGRILVDNGFTRIYDMFWKLAGTEKLMSNMIIWLTGVVK